jgi:hypothetical protein
MTLNNKKTQLILQEEKNIFRQSSITPLKKFYLWLTLFAVGVGVYLLLANGHITFGNVFACGVCFLVAMLWAADGLKTKLQ